MIDFHTHILPGMDDGCKSVAESLWMLRQEQQQGVDTVVLTPHYYPWENSPEEFLARRSRAWEALKKQLPEDSPRLLLGAEVHYFEGMGSAPQLKMLRISGTDLLLLEMPFARWTQRMVEDLLECASTPNIQVVLAHAERYFSLQPKAIWPRLRGSGIWMQANVSFFSSWKTRYQAMRMLQRGEIQFLGSDCHRQHWRAPNWDTLPPKIAGNLQSTRHLEPVWETVQV